jgi:hypothetical protein
MVKKIKIVIFLSFLIFSFEDSSKCENGDWIDNNICECKEKYSTYPHDAERLCSYKKKLQWIAFLLEAIPSFGIGHLYIKNYGFGIGKLIFWLITWLLLILMRYYSVQREWKDEMALKFGLFSSIFTTVLIIWYITDLVLFGLNRYTDGNNIDLYPW